MLNFIKSLFKPKKDVFNHDSRINNIIYINNVNSIKCFYSLIIKRCLTTDIREYNFHNISTRFIDISHLGSIINNVITKMTYDINRISKLEVENTLMDKSLGLFLFTVDEEYVDKNLDVFINFLNTLESYINAIENCTDYSIQNYRIIRILNFEICTILKLIMEVNKIYI